jgi:hypothetical protein
MFRLPVSGIVVEAHPPGGAEEVLLWEARSFDRGFALELVRRLTTLPQPERLVVHDFEALLLHLYRVVFGDAISADSTCNCGERVDISFSVSQFLVHRAPRRPRRVTATQEAGWFSLQQTDVTFRLPVIEDQFAVAGEADPVQALAARCVRGSPVPAAVDRAMAAMAPPLSGAIEGVCPHCARTIHLHFDVPSFVLRELQVQASLICEHVHLLAGHYHWTEEKILALPNRRRQVYVEMVAAGRRGTV